MSLVMQVLFECTGTVAMKNINPGQIQRVHNLYIPSWTCVIKITLNQRWNLCLFVIILNFLAFLYNESFHLTAADMSFIYKRNNRGPSIGPCCTTAYIIFGTCHLTTEQLLTGLFWKAWMKANIISRKNRIWDEKSVGAIALCRDPSTHHLDG